MKKIIVFILLYSVLICLASCNSQESGSRVYQYQTETVSSETTQHLETKRYIPTIPQVGMSEKVMNNTKLGPYSEIDSIKTPSFAHKKHLCYNVWWRNSDGKIYFSASVIDGKVTDVTKFYEDKYWKGNKYIGPQ